MRRLLIALAACGLIALLLFPIYKVSLSSGVSSLSQLSAGGRP
jgi:hypothetical protein